jgi:hypothetical protein
MSSITDLWNISNSWNLYKKQMRDKTHPEYRAIDYAERFSTKRMKINNLPLPPSEGGNIHDYDRKIAEREYLIIRENIAEQTAGMVETPQTLFGFRIDARIKLGISSVINKLMKEQRGIFIKEFNVDKLNEITTTFKELTDLYNTYLKDIFKDAQYKIDFQTKIVQVETLFKKMQQLIIDKTSGANRLVLDSYIYVTPEIISNDYIIKSVNQMISVCDLMLKGVSVSQYTDVDLNTSSIDLDRFTKEDKEGDDGDGDGDGKGGDGTGDGSAAAGTGPGAGPGAGPKPGPTSKGPGDGSAAEGTGPGVGPDGPGADESKEADEDAFRRKQEDFLLGYGLNTITGFTSAEHLARTRDEDGKEMIGPLYIRDVKQEFEGNKYTIATNEHMIYMALATPDASGKPPELDGKKIDDAYMIPEMTWNFVYKTKDATYVYRNGLFPTNYLYSKIKLPDKYLEASASTPAMSSTTVPNLYVRQLGIMIDGSKYTILEERADPPDMSYIVLDESSDPEEKIEPINRKMGAKYKVPINMWLPMKKRLAGPYVYQNYKYGSNELTSKTELPFVYIHESYDLASPPDGFTPRTRTTTFKTARERAEVLEREATEEPELVAAPRRLADDFEAASPAPSSGVGVSSTPAPAGEPASGVVVSSTRAPPASAPKPSRTPKYEAPPDFTAKNKKALSLNISDNPNRETLVSRLKNATMVANEMCRRKVASGKYNTVNFSGQFNDVLANYITQLLNLAGSSSVVSGNVFNDEMYKDFIARSRAADLDVYEPLIDPLKLDIFYKKLETGLKSNTVLSKRDVQSIMSTLKQQKIIDDLNLLESIEGIRKREEKKVAKAATKSKKSRVVDELLKSPPSLKSVPVVGSPAGAPATGRRREGRK